MIKKYIIRTAKKENDKKNERRKKQNETRNIQSNEFTA